MAIFDYQSLKSKYGDFSFPFVKLIVNGKEFSKNKNNFILSDVDIELTSDYEASIAGYTIYNTFDMEQSAFLSNDVKNYIALGSPVEIALGYGDQGVRVFNGFIAKVNFVYPEDDMPGIRVTALDVKGIMMANNYSRQLKAKSYGEAVKEILDQNVYADLRNKGIIDKLTISDTPDKQQGGNSKKETDRTIEMVCESDYEFVVKAAKKYNYEFFAECGTVFFRKAKSNDKVLIELGPKEGLRSMDVEYDITSLVSSVEARGMDTGKGNAIVGKKKFSNKISMGNHAAKMIKKNTKVYIDTTITSQREADSRAESILEDMSYKFGTLKCECFGLPELMPGYFVKLIGLGQPPNNLFYITSVRHILSNDAGFVTILTGKAPGIGGSF